MRMNKTVIKVVSFCLIFCIMFLNVQSIFQAKWGNEYYRTKNFYAEKDNIDVVFVGSSHIYCTINPLLLFYEYGFTSCNFASSGQDFSQSYMYIKEAIEKNKPKVIVLDMLGAFYFNLSEENSRKAFDPMPLSKEKIKKIHYLFTRNEEFQQGNTYDSFVSYLTPLLRYHDRWKELIDDDFNNNKNAIKYLHGYVPKYKIVSADFSKYKSERNVNIELLIEQKKQLEEIVALCENNNVSLVLMKSPTPMWREKYSEEIEQWAKEVEVPFIDYNILMKKLDIHEDSDFSDSTSHLNDIGASKVTKHIGLFLVENYELDNHKNDLEYNSWQVDWNKYYNEKINYWSKVEK